MTKPLLLPYLADLIAAVLSKPKFPEAGAMNLVVSGGDSGNRIELGFGTSNFAAASLFIGNKLVKTWTEITKTLPMEAATEFLTQIGEIK
jgi:hypothetical protein